jgi:translation initiation factor IF-1
VKEELVQMQGTVVHRLKNALVIALDGGLQVRAVLSGRMLGNGIHAMAGDRVSVEFSPHDPSLGRVVYRLQ